MNASDAAETLRTASVVNYCFDPLKILLLSFHLITTSKANYALPVKAQLSVAHEIPDLSAILNGLLGKPQPEGGGKCTPSRVRGNKATEKHA